MSRVMLNGHLAFGRAQFPVRGFRIHRERHMLEIHAAGRYIGIYR